MREAVRSGRRTNFFITENRFIDLYAAKVGGSGVAVYSILQRCANSETRETWISAQKMADVLAMDKSTIYRHLKQLEDLQLIKTLRTREKTIYVVLPVPPPRPEAGATPLFDSMDDVGGEKSSSWSPVASARIDCSSESELYQQDGSVAPVPQRVASVQSSNGVREKRNKEEQDELNKTQEQDFFNKSERDLTKAAKTLVNGLMLPDTFLSAAKAAIEDAKKYSDLSMDYIVVEIVHKARRAAARRMSHEKFLEQFLAKRLAEIILGRLGVPATSNMVSAATEAVKAEVIFAGISVEDAAARIADAASADMARGSTIDSFYFENAKWRSHGRASKAEQRKLDNLAANARAREILRGQLR